MRIRPTSLTHSGVASFFSRHAVTRSGILVGDAPPPSPFPAATDRSFVSAFLLLHHKSKREGGREGGSFLFFPRFYCYCCPSILCSLLTTDWHGGLATDGVHEKKKKEGREGGGEISFLPSHFVPRPLPFEGRRNTSHPSDAAAADADAAAAAAGRHGAPSQRSRASRKAVGRSGRRRSERERDDRRPRGGRADGRTDKPTILPPLLLLLLLLLLRGECCGCSSGNSEWEIVKVCVSTLFPDGHFATIVILVARGVSVVTDCLSLFFGYSSCKFKMGLLKNRDLLCVRFLPAFMTKS